MTSHKLTGHIDPLALESPGFAILKQRVKTDVRNVPFYHQKPADEQKGSMIDNFLAGSKMMILA
jgi:hypothetical protein